jgi:hypothetical protein
MEKMLAEAEGGGLLHLQGRLKGARWGETPSSRDSIYMGFDGVYQCLFAAKERKERKKTGSSSLGSM